MSFARRRSIALLAYLATNRRRYHRETLAALLWPESDRSSALASLRQVLADIRRATGMSLLVETGDTIEVSPSVVADVTEFRSALAPAPDDLSTVLKALPLYRGDFMDGFYLSGCEELETWQQEENESLRALHEITLERTVRLLLKRGEAVQARLLAGDLERRYPYNHAAADLVDRCRRAGDDDTGVATLPARGRSGRRVMLLAVVLAVMLTAAGLGLFLTSGTPAGHAEFAPPVVSIWVVTRDELRDDFIGALRDRLIACLEQSGQVRVPGGDDEAGYQLDLSLVGPEEGPTCRVELSEATERLPSWMREYPVSRTALGQAYSRAEDEIGLDILAGRITVNLLQYLAQSGEIQFDPTINPSI